MAELFNLAFLENLKILIAAILIYALIFAVLKKIAIFGDSGPVNSLIALMSAIIVSFSGVVTYSISYAINWFVILLFIVFLLILVLMFLGVDASHIGEVATNNSKTILYIFIILFSVILLKSFFALNNSFDTNNPQDDQYEIDSSFNTGVDDITNEELEDSFIVRLFKDIDPDVLSAVMFLAVLGIFVYFLGR